MLHPLDDTIVAVSSARGGAARAIVRLSGPRALTCAATLFEHQEKGSELFFAAANLPVHARVPINSSDPFSASLPCEVYHWPQGHSYTGQEVVELHTLGSPPLADALLGALCQAGARLAQPGEFTLRAFLSGRIDLTRAEAVLGVIDAPDRHALDVALAQLAGGLAAPLARLREELIDVAAHLEAGLDFADEDLALVPRDELARRVAQAAAAVDDLLRRMGARGEGWEKPRVVLFGWPNSGKSSLFNALLGHPGAIVSDHAGTTRDYLTAELDLDGLKCTLVDTAGTEPAPADEAPSVESSPQRSAQVAAGQQREQAAIRLFCLDATRDLRPWERQQLAVADASRLVVLTKLDAIGPRPSAKHPPLATPTSSLTGEGIPLLRERLREALLCATAGGEAVPGTAARCGQSLRLAGQSLGRAEEILRSGQNEELAAAELRVALDELGQVVGAVYTDDLLDRVFSRFCIGK